jgi:hypothetical protein
MAAIPVVFSLSPNNGPVSTPTVIGINGIHLTGVTAVNFNSVAGSANPTRSVAGTNISGEGDGLVNVTTPTLVAGNYDVIVTTANGTSFATPGGIFTAS